MKICQLVDKTGVLGVECFSLYPAKGDYLSVYGSCYKVLDRVITTMSDSRHVVLFLSEESPGNSALEEWRSSPTALEGTDE